MAYATGTFTSPDGLLAAIRSFASLNGWTENGYVADGTGFRLHINKSTVYLNFRSAVAEDLINTTIYLNGENPGVTTGVACSASTGYAGASAWNAQPGSIYGGGYSGIFNVSVGGTAIYRMFSSVTPDMLFCVAETGPGFYQFLGGGMLEKVGTYIGGEWMTGSFFGSGATGTTGGQGSFGSGATYGLLPLPFWCAYYFAPATVVRAEYDTYTGFGYIAAAGAPIPAGLPGPQMRSLFEARDIINVFSDLKRASLGYRWYWNAPNAMNGVTPMIPFDVRGPRNSGYFSPLGYTPHLRFLNIANFNPGAVMTLGSETWMVFPGYIKTTDPAVPGTLNFGYAVRYVP